MIIKRLYLITFIVSLSVLDLCAQTQLPLNTAEIKLGIQKLNTLGSVLYFAAHPDDENTRLIAWLANEKKYRTGYISLTRGDGGQNLIGTEQAEELGLIRTQELLQARRVDGGEQFFARVNDFGFSKTYDETFRIWGREQVLADAVWVIRNFKPDVIITRFPPDERGGHGHHQASAILAIEAFKAAADPSRFPEQLQYAEVWQAKRLLWNAASFARNLPAADNQFSINIGEYNPLLGQSYGEVAAESRSNHKSQGFGSARQRGDIKETFEVLAGDLPQETLFDGIETSWNRIAGTENIQRIVDQLQESFDLLHPEKSVNDLLKLLEEVEQLADHYWKAQKSKEIKDLLLACAGIWFEAYASDPKYAIGEDVPVTGSFIVRRPEVNVSVKAFRPANAADVDSENQQLTVNQLLQLPISFVSDRITQPYWLAQPHGLGSFTVTNQLNIGHPENQDNPSTLVVLDINGKEVNFERPIVYKFTDPVRGEVYQPLVITPAITANLSQKAMVFNGNQPRTLDVVFTNHENLSAEKQTTATLQLPDGWRVDTPTVTLGFQSRDEEISKRFTIYPASETSLTDSLKIVLQHDDKASFAHAIRQISYDHIPQITWFPPTAVKLNKVATAHSSQRIGYLMGAGDLVPQALRDIGLQVDLLQEQDVISGDLSQYDAIVTGVRLYNVNKRIRYMQPALLRYVAQGGTLVVQYNVNSPLIQDGLGPYPFKLSRDRVTEEDALVSFVKPASRVLRYPNTITAGDFDGWVQERGLYFVSEADKRYEKPLSMHDEQESPLDGALLVTTYGKGNFIYTSLSFFRQLPAGVPGAYRLFVNLLAKPE